MRHPRLAAIARTAIAGGLGLMLLSSIEAAIQQPAHASPALADQVAEMVNAERAAAGLDPLPRGGDAEAQANADRMAADGQLAHLGHGLAGREAVGMTTGRAGRIVVAMMESPGHRSILLDAEADRLAVGAGCHDDGALYVAVIAHRVTGEHVGRAPVDDPGGPLVTSRSQGTACPQPQPQDTTTSDDDDSAASGATDGASGGGSSGTTSAGGSPSAAGATGSSTPAPSQDHEHPEPGAGLAPAGTADAAGPALRGDGFGTDGYPWWTRGTTSTSQLADAAARPTSDTARPARVLSSAAARQRIDPAPGSTPLATHPAVLVPTVLAAAIPAGIVLRRRGRRAG